MEVKEIAAVPPVRAALLKPVKVPICLDAGKKDYEVKELETGVICYRKNNEAVRKQLQELQGAVQEREKVVPK